MIYASRSSEQLSPMGRKRARIVGPEALLITCIAGTPLSIGKASLTDREVAFNQQINAVVPHDMNSKFLWAQLRVCRALVQQKSTGGMKGLVSKSQLQQVAVLDPPMQQQRLFVARLEEVLRLIDAGRRAIKVLEDLRTTLAQTAFAGSIRTKR